jgi:hypothetical protein
MKQLYFNAIGELNKYIKLCGSQLQSHIDPYSLTHWQSQLEKTIRRKKRIEMRLKVQDNVVYVDFIAKRKVS